MEWFYVETNERRGPVTEAALREILGSGRITPDTLVWKQGMANWAPLHTALPPGGPPPLTGQQRCIVTGKFYPTAQMLQTEHGWVSFEGKDTYYQCLREGVPLPAIAGEVTAWADGKRVVVFTSNPQLPLRCFKTNLPVTAAELKRRKLYWASPWYALTILLNLLIYLIVYLVVRKKVELDLPLSADGRAQVRKHSLIAWSIALAGIACIFAPAFAYGLTKLILLGFVLILVGLIYGAFRASAVRIVKLAHGRVWLAGAGPAFLASLPRYTG
jgi:hypothetical protein